MNWHRVRDGDHAHDGKRGAPNAPKRRDYSPELKTQVVAECWVAGASVAGVALAHGINAN
ncbi:transposase [Polaromonas jejuensis]|uniref:Transposase n=1 Tax=Polaromonas jejuensis TaxID=457502 RepID=A0ABW0QA08_9BURK|nr:transposase [Polaromonas jejuensis]